MGKNKKIIIVAGPTASGKSDFAIEIATRIGGVIINADSVQLYKDIPILSAQPSKSMLSKIPHRLYSVLESYEATSVGGYQMQAVQVINEIHNQEKIPIIVGGTGLYIKSIIEGLSNIPEIDNDTRSKIRDLFANIGNEEFYKILTEKDPVMASKLNIGDSHRLIRAMEVIQATGKSLDYWHNLPIKKPFENAKIFTLVLMPERSMLYEKCNLRFQQMIEFGAIEEVKNLLNKNFSNHITKAIGVNQIIKYLKGEIELNNAIEEGKTLTRQYAKRQFTWFNNQLSNSYKAIYQNIQDLYKDKSIKEVINSFIE
ncbi:MAG: tRNA (adenosine(37)-N6)-dimethylallyltransferase MiaA [Alphaproteobacteria bacterium]